MANPSERELPSALSKKSPRAPLRELDPANFSTETLEQSLDDLNYRESALNLIVPLPQTMPDLFPYPSEITSETAFQYREAKYMNEFLTRYPDAITVWDHGRLLQGPYQNIARHNARAGMYAEILTELLGVDEGKEQLQQYEKMATVRAALYHDAGKIREIERLDHVLSTNGTITPADLNDLKAQDTLDLVDLGVPAFLATLSGSNVPFPNLFEPGGELPGTRAREIVWFVDAMLYDESPSAISYRLAAGRAAGENGGARRGKRNDTLNTALENQYRMPYYKVQQQIGEAVSLKLVEEIVERNPHLEYLLNKPAEESLPEFLGHEFERRVRQIPLPSTEELAS